ncbi:metallophosphoesterase family protein [Deinococcus detaillensis]|uniref:Metallophosphoesterase family protein n=1 Tax=Deinococcus detaillensis TaxID=2592048 RepID=A0A553V0F6_9DEIO|nr:metallophosphoesterase family protein [Deinococcus detaillensis]TSA85943.1 metallophosphoesterase family protein [Deinococcus detaillensis]
MRVAVISDVHGNAFALRAVLDDLRDAAPDVVFNLGDQVEGAANPALAYQLQVKLGAVEVRGNNEEKLWPNGRRNPLSQKYGAWLEQQLTPEALARLAALPLTAWVEDVLACHGTPTSAWDSLLWVWQPTNEGGFYRSRDPRELRRMLEPLSAGVVVCGHTHRAGSTRVGDTLVVNAGSVSDQVDGDPRARWTLLERRSGRWTADFRAVPYAIAAATHWATQHSPFGEGQAALLESGEMTVRGEAALTAGGP